MPPEGLAACLEHLAPMLPTAPETILVQGEMKTAAERLSKEVYAFVGCQICTYCPWLAPRSFHLPDSLALPGPCQLRWASAWWTATPSTYLLAGPLRLAVRRHLGLPVFAPDIRCQYAPLRTGRTCGTPLGPFSGHVRACAQGPRLHRHHALVRQWRCLLMAAGYTVQLEQDVLLETTASKQADLVARHENGDQLALDVLVTGSPDLAQPVDGHLDRQARQKASRYESQPHQFLAASVSCLWHTAPVLTSSMARRLPFSCG